jgi:hypothetical protein
MGQRFRISYNYERILSLSKKPGSHYGCGSSFFSCLGVACFVLNKNKEMCKYTNSKDTEILTFSDETRSKN